MKRYIMTQHMIKIGPYVTVQLQNYSSTETVVVRRCKYCTVYSPALCPSNTWYHTASLTSLYVDQSHPNAALSGLQSLLGFSHT